MLKIVVSNRATTRHVSPICFQTGLNYNGLVNCSPSRCPHRKLMEQARAACLSCEGGGEPTGKAGMVSFDAAGESVVSKTMLHRSTLSLPRVTSLPSEHEDVIADLFRSWVSLSAVDALLVLHVCNGGTTADFGTFLATVSDSIARMDPERPAMRATAWARFKALVRRFSVVDKVRTWTDGHGGAVRKEMAKRRGDVGGMVQEELF